MGIRWLALNVWVRYIMLGCVRTRLFQLLFYQTTDNSVINFKTEVAFNLWRAIKLKANERGAFVFIEFDCFLAIRSVAAYPPPQPPPPFIPFLYASASVDIFCDAADFSFAIFHRLLRAFRLALLIGDHLVPQHLITARMFTIHGR